MTCHLPTLAQISMVHVRMCLGQNKGLWVFAAWHLVTALMARPYACLRLPTLAYACLRLPTSPRQVEMGSVFVL